MELNKRISDFENGNRIEGFYILKNTVIRTTAAGKPFLSGTLIDISGSIESKMWDFPYKTASEFDGEIVKVRGDVTEYKGALQFTISLIRLPGESDVIDKSMLLPTAPIDIQASLNEISAIISSMRDADYRKLCNAALDLHSDTFSTLPAAKSVHHSFISGLLMHTLSMLRLADYLSAQYSSVVSRDLLLSGVLLHDLNKDKEFSLSSLGLVTDYSVSGTLLSHSIMGAYEIKELSDKLNIPDEKAMLLEHLVLSHHGEPEFGAAVIPCCAEAELLSYIDKIDSRMEIYREALSEINDGELSSKIYALEKRIYRHSV